MSLASPLSLLHRAAEDGIPAEEVLLLSYTLDLGFVERLVLGPAQALGARVTVVGDAAFADYDPRAVRRAGRTYTTGLAYCSGEFHPKLLVIAGEDHATVAIGSGNVTLAGWSDNAELWSVLRADSNGAPAALTALADWLEALDTRVAFGPHVPRALERTAKWLRGFPALSDGPQLVTSLERPILDQLPSGPVDILEVFAPFHDPNGDALAALCERLRPARVRVAVQPQLTVADGAALRTVAASYDGDVVAVDGAPYRHGKLVEWSRDGQRYALTGSANCSGAALLKTIGNGGNCELALITRVEQSLMPDAVATLGGEALNALKYRPRITHRPSLLLLGATRTEDGIEVLLARPAPRPGYVELSAPTADPDTWERAGEFPSGARRVTVGLAADGGTRIRVVLDAASADEPPMVSPFVFVIDPNRALNKPGTFGAARRPTEPFDLFDDLHLAEQFVADLERLRVTLTLPGAIATPVPTRAERGATRAGSTTWQDYLDACSGRVGYSLLRFALGLPTIDPDWSDVAGAVWDERIGDDEAGLDDDTTEAAAADEQEARRALRSMADRPAYLRHRYQRFASRLAAHASALEPPERLLALRLILWIVAADAWDYDDRAWVPDVAAAVVALAAPPPAPDEAQPHLASLAAVGLAVLRSTAPRTHTTLEGRAFADVAKKVAHLLPDLDDRYLTQYASVLDRRFGPALLPGAIADLAAEVVQDDPLESAVRGLADLDFDAHVHGRVLHVPCRVANPEVPALLAIGLAEHADPVGAWAGTGDDWALMIWRRPDVVVARQERDRPLRWTAYRLGELAGPQSHAASARRLPGERRRWSSFPGQPLDPIVQQLLIAVGLDDPVPPHCPSAL